MTIVGKLHSHLAQIEDLLLMVSMLVIGYKETTVKYLDTPCPLCMICMVIHYIQICLF